MVTDLRFVGQMFKDDCGSCRRTSGKNVEIHAKLLMAYGLSPFASRQLEISVLFAQVKFPEIHTGIICLIDIITNNQ